MSRAAEVEAPPRPAAPEEVDVLIVGAGLSGIGAACHLRRRCPDKTVAILEARDAIGGTWDLFRFPGVRSDSDMFTLGYSFRPWTGTRAIADGDTIRRYVQETAAENGVDRLVRYGHRVLGAAWSGEEHRWTVTAQREGGPVQLRCRFLYVCSGYYRYDEGYLPVLPGAQEFQGRIAHPQHWPAELDCAGKRVVVLGSGATAVTMVPALAPTAASVTMVQRSPSYILSLPSRDPVAARLRGALPARPAAQVVRWKNILVTLGVFQLSRRRPALMKSLLRRGVVAQLGAEFEVDPHFTPRYDPWAQRLCLVPDGDLFSALRSGRASIVTAEIEKLTADGLQLASGAHLPADVVVTATGLNLLPLGGLALTVDGRRIDYGDTVAYKGLMLAGVPNLAFCLGYTNASWTLRADLVSRYVCRLIRRMDRRGYLSCVPQAPRSLPRRPILDLTSGYVQRSVARLPKQGPVPPWRFPQNYLREVLALTHGRLEDRALWFSGPSA